MCMVSCRLKLPPTPSKDAKMAEIVLERINLIMIDSMRKHARRERPFFSRGVWGEVYLLLSIILHFIFYHYKIVDVLYFGFYAN